MSTVTLDNKTILVTGAAGFIGSNLVKRIYQEVPSATVIGIDNMNAYYDVALKEFRLNELMAHAYSKLYNLSSTGLHFFTVYGSAGCPDMAYFSFTNKLVKGETIKIFNYGNCK